MQWSKRCQRACYCSEFTIATEVGSRFPNPPELKITCFVKGVNAKMGGGLITERPKTSVQRKSRVHEREGLKALLRFTATHLPLGPPATPASPCTNPENKPPSGTGAPVVSVRSIQLDCRVGGGINRVSTLFSR